MGADPAAPPCQVRFGARERQGRGQGATVGSLVFASAVTGVPPFYGVSLATGALGMRLRSFVLNGFGGRLVRFGAIAWAGNRFGDAAVLLFGG